MAYLYKVILHRIPVLFPWQHFYEISRSVVPLCDWSVDTGYDTYCKSLQPVWYNNKDNQISEQYKYDVLGALDMCKFMKPDLDYLF